VVWRVIVFDMAQMFFCLPETVEGFHLIKSPSTALRVTERIIKHSWLFYFFLFLKNILFNGKP